MKIYKLDYINPLMNSHHSHFLAFDIEFNDWIQTSDLNDCDIIPVLVPYSNEDIITQCNFIKSKGYKDQMIVGLDLFHADDQVDDIKRYNNFKDIIKSNLTSKVVVIHTNKENKSDIFYDFLWNRQKAYFTDYNKFDLNDRVWTWGSNIKMYGLSRIFKFPDCRIFLCPNRIQYVDNQIAGHHRFHCRKKLLDFLQDKDGFVSQPAQNIILDPEQDDLKDALLGGRSGTWYPVANNLYNSSFVSIYIETITMTSSMAFKYKTITEKTWDPLIKGHFILPFGYQGLIEDIKSYGFWLPDWIDYSYDNIYDDNQRFESYLHSVDKICKLPKQELLERFNESITFLQSNRLLFWSQPYDNLHTKLSRYIKDLYS